MVIDIVSWVSVGLIFIGAAVILSNNDWRICLGALAIQYLGVFWLVTRHLPFAMGTVKLIVGWMVIAILGMTNLSRSNEEKEDVQPFPYGRMFRLSLMGIIGLVTVGSSLRIEAIIPGMGLPVIAGGLILIGAGVAQLGVTSDIFRVIVGLLSTLAGFEIMYAAVESAILVTGLLAAVNLGLAFTGAYLLMAGTVSSEPENEGLE